MKDSLAAKVRPVTTAASERFDHLSYRLVAIAICAAALVASGGADLAEGTIGAGVLMVAQFAFEHFTRDRR